MQFRYLPLSGCEDDNGSKIQNGTAAHLPPSSSSSRINETEIHQPRNLLILPLSRLHLQAPVVHLVHITSSLHVALDVILQVPYGFQGVGYALILLDVADDLGGFGAFGKVD